MADIAENANTPDMIPRQSGLISTVFRDYWENFALFWRIMMPVILFGFLFDIGTSFSDSFFAPESLWRFDTARGVSVGEYPRSTGVGWGWIFVFHVFSIGFLWLTMCPLIFTIVERHRDVEGTSRGAWRHARGKAGPILVSFFLLYVFGVVGFLPFSLLASGIISGAPLPYGSSLHLGLFLIAGIVIYWGINWSLYNQIIVIEDQKSTITALRRSSELVRGIWGSVVGMYLLLALVTMMMTSVLLRLTLLLFSLSVPEFAPLREVLLSAKFLTLFVGGYARISFENIPSFWSVAVMAPVNTLIHALLAPVWAILTTHLYIERTAIGNRDSEIPPTEKLNSPRILP